MKENIDNQELRCAAIRQIDEFLNSETLHAIKNIAKESFVAALKRHIEKPFLVQQGFNGTCGAAVLSKFLAEEFPNLYAEIAISLFSTGSFRRNGVEICLPKASFESAASNLSELQITSADAVVQGALINSQNFLLDYNPFRDGSGAKSFMYPRQLIKYLEKFTDVACNYISNPNIKTLRSLDFCKKFIIGIVHSGKKDKIHGVFPNHYVQICDFRENVMEFWSWGGYHKCEISENRLANGVFALISVEKRTI